MNIRFNDLPVATDCVCIHNGQAVWSNYNGNGDVPPDVAMLTVDRIHNMDGLLIVYLKEGETK